MIPKAKRKDKQKGAPPSALTTDAASSIPQKNLFWGPSAPGAPRQMENGGSSHDEGAPRASRRRSRRLRDKSPPDYSADEIISLVADPLHHNHHRIGKKQHPQQQELQEHSDGGKPQQRHKKRGAPRGLASSKPSSRRPRREDSRGVTAEDPWGGTLSLSIPGRHAGGPVSTAPTSGQAFEPASSPLSALAPTVAASGAETGDEACVLVPLKQARALLASASPAAIQLAAAAAKPLPQVAPQNRYCATGGRGPWGPPHFEDIGGEVPPVESPHAETIVALRPPHTYKGAFPEVGCDGDPLLSLPSLPCCVCVQRHPSMALASLPASRLPTLSHGGHPVVDPAVPPRVASFPQGFPAKDHPARHLQQLAGGPPRGPQGTAGPRTPERLHEHLAAEGRSYTVSALTNQQLANFHTQRMDAGGLTVGRPGGLGPTGGDALHDASLRVRSLRDDDNPQTDAAGAIPKAPVDVPQKGVSSYCFREQGPLGGPPRPQWREPERQALRAPAPHFGALRDPPDTPAAAAVLHLEGPPTTASRQAASAEMALELRQRPQATSGLLASGEPPRENDISRELTSSSSLPFQRGMMNGATSGAASGLRMALPTFDALAAVLAPPPPEDRGPSRDSSAARNKDLKTKGRVSVSGVFLDAAFPAARTPPADFQTIPLERHGPPRQALLAVASAAAKDTLEALKKGGRIVLRLPWAEGGSSPSEKTPQAADIANRTCAVNKDPKAPVGVPPPPTPQHTPESLRRSVAALVGPLNELESSGGPYGPPVEIDAAASALAIVRVTPASRAAAAAGSAAAAAAAALRKASFAPTAAGERESTIATAGEAVTAAADFLGQVLAATLDAWRLSLLEKRNSHQISPAKADALGAIAEVAAGLALEQLQKRSRSLRMAFEDTQRTRLENTERQRNERLAQESKGAALTAFLSVSLPDGEGRQEEAEIRVAPRTVQQLQADCIAAAEATGQLSIVSQSALATHRKQLRKIESQMVLRANQALRLLEVLEQKKRQLLGSAALFHRCVMPETDEKTVLSRLQKFQLHAERIPVDEVENEVNGAQRSRGRGGFGGSVRAPRRSSLECRLSDCSLFTASYPHSQEDFRFSLSSLLNDSPSSLKATTPPEGTLAEGPLEESLPVAPQERPLEADTPQDAAREARTIHSRTQETACLFEQPQIQGVDPPETTTPVRIGMSRPIGPGEGFTGTFSLRSLMGSRHMR
ncbi:uncharacterized protein LOC34618831 [Cyclospora cayetanensis]|uniref:Uncharacterized protein LOC34618831 n=1 Tax=Cyclospora cayetanensis TaxID=88456 RepID=A0A6P6S1K3_9EIME|nr:uncharacterized protein LOC34618831 [Cyclospora cayetanensis]